MQGKHQCTEYHAVRVFDLWLKYLQCGVLISGWPSLVGRHWLAVIGWPSLQNIIARKCKKP